MNRPGGGHGTDGCGRRSVAEYRQAAPQCACHTYFPVAEVGGWLHGNTADTLAPVTEWATRADLWERAELGYSGLDALVVAAGGITCEYALEATTLSDGRVRLHDSVHRWVITSERGLIAVPVAMRTDVVESAFAWIYRPSGSGHGRKRGDRRQVRPYVRCVRRQDVPGRAV